jgi:4-diphosphocytidyl-2-C-methyl-D-erythritol kinase
VSADWGRAVVLAPCKVNLFLEVERKRDDGYHELETVLLALDRADRIAVRVVERAPGAPPVALTLSGPGATPDVPLDGQNLAWRAAEAVHALARERYAALERRALRRELEKRLPSPAGRGGGSADAAGAAFAAATALGLDADDPALVAALARLGSDCPFFLAARSSGLAVGRGRGERIEVAPAPRTPWALAVIVPDVACATPAVYGALRVPAACDRRPLFAPHELFALPLEDARRALFNRLEEAALASHPELVPWRELLDRTDGAHFRLCGSGAGFFGMFASVAAAEEALGALVARAKARDLGLRARFVARPACAGVRLGGSK